MMAIGPLVAAEYLLPAAGAVVIAIMMIRHRRGGARVLGVLGAAFLLVGLIFHWVYTLPFLINVDLGFFGAAARGVLTGAGLIVVCLVAVSGSRSGQARRRNLVPDQEE